MGDDASVNDVCVGPSSEQAGKAASCAGCPNQAACTSGAGRAVDPALAQVAERMRDIRHKILVLSGKGGVGKSTFAAQLAWTLSERFQVGVLDVDICGPSVPLMFGVSDDEVHRSSAGWSPVYASDNIAVMSVGFMLQSKTDAVVWRGPRKTALIKQFLADVDWGTLDFLVVDAPPGTSDEHLSVTQYLKESAPDGAIIVTTPQEMALLDVRKEISFCRKAGINIIGVVENMSGFVCPCCRHETAVFSGETGGARGMCKEMQVPFLGSIPLDPRLMASCEKGVSFVRTHPDAPTADALRQAIAAVLDSSESLRATAAMERPAADQDDQPMVL
ncbi:Cytosolic Fe-S cluster assembly factor NUBP1 like protein [Plasmodiophora brassicae]|uniref:Cytosolic Fe-S cluster assembly factor NUBP1 homolog n=1 Tax=Plasmodiophora brassicae TaxID=37360 RepID=A0A0G4J8W6_PLABS|nr:hypothetical protein PBRA_003323 [Plasmodiophora brassicae]SPQ99677.1 unnamed protein product [Plasmodiophora brassicae]